MVVPGSVVLMPAVLRIVSTSVGATSTVLILVFVLSVLSREFFDFFLFSLFALYPQDLLVTTISSGGFLVFDLYR